MKRSHILYGKKLLSLLTLLLLVLSLLNALSLNMVGVSALEYPAIYIDPATTVGTELMPGKNYTISIKTDYTGDDIWSWQFALTYDPRVLHGGVRKTDMWFGVPTKTDTWTGNGTTQVFNTTGTPVVPDSEKVYVNETLMIKPDNYKMVYPEGKILFPTAPGLGANVTATYQYLTYSTTETPVEDSEEVYVNGTLTTRIARRTDVWIANGVTRTFYTTQPISPGTETVLVNRRAPILEGLDCDIDDSTGKITFTPAPKKDAEIKVTYDTLGQYTINYEEGNITFETPPGEVEIKATYLCGGITNGDLINKDKYKTVQFVPGSFDNTIGELSMTGAKFDYGIEEPASGPGTLANVTFTVVGKGTSDMMLTLGPETALMGYKHGTWYYIIDSGDMPDHIQDGYFDNRFEYDVAVGSVTAQAEATVGFVSINVEVLNLGKYNEFVEVAVYNDSVLIGPEETLSVYAGLSDTAFFSWDTKGLAQGSYTLNATATILMTEDDDPTDNRNTGTFLLKHDVAVASVTAPAKAAVDSLVPISVEVANSGSVTEVANVTIRHDSTYIDSQNITILVKESETALLSWNTTDLTKDDYALNATATILEDDDPTDNWNTATTFLVEHDVAVVNVTATAKVPVGDPVFINVTVANISAHQEDVNVTIRYDSTYIDSQNVTLAKGLSKTALFSWDTTDLKKGSYALNATATILEDDDPTDNWNTATTFLVEHDVAVIYLDAPAEAVVGDPVFINVTVANISGYEEDVNVTIRYDSTYIDSQNVTLAKGLSKTALFSWDTTDLTQATYTLNATATIPEDGDPTDNWKTTTILLAKHDVAVTYISTSPLPPVYAGELVTIRVLVANLGWYNETFDVEVEVTHDTTSIIEKSESVTLDSGASQYIPFSWDTTGVAAGSYTITAKAILDGDVDSSNDLTDRSVVVNLRPGAIAGTVTDSSTGDPIEGATVTANGYSDTTDAEGHYNITDIPAGTYTVTASKDGYESSSQTDIIVVAGNTTQVDFELTPVQSPNIPYFLYAGVAAIAIIIIAAIAVYILKVRKPKPT